MKPSAISSGDFPPTCFAQFREGVLYGLGVQRLVLLRAENLREEVGDELADQNIGVGDGEGAVAAVAFRAGIGAGGIRTDAEAGPVEMQAPSRRRPRRYG